ncbi:MAG: ABC transporter permease [Alphaproteobacteria bacterium]
MAADMSADPATAPSDSAPARGRRQPLEQHKRLGAVNWIGLWTLYAKEVRRFLNVYTQTIVAPVITTLLFYAVFALALGGQIKQAGGVSFMTFLAPGLIIMGMVQNAFANTSSTLVISKVQGNIVDVLMPPLSALELTLGYVGGGVTRGLVVGLAVGIGIALFADVSVQSWGLVIYHAFMGSMMLSLLGVLGGIWSEKFDHIAAVTNFIITPMTFLSGTFYTIDRLPESWQTVALFNPFFYMIDGFRHGFIGHSDISVWTGMIVMAGVNAALFGLAWNLFSRGYKLKP